MKILYVCRLYSGFEDSLKSGIWSPRGAPTIARMIEHLDKSQNHDLHVLLTQKGNNANDLSGVYKLDGLHVNITVLAGKNSLPAALGRLREKISDALQLYKILITYHHLKPDLVYCDRVNILPAAIISRFAQAPVIWRVMGILEEMHRDVDLNTLRAKINRWMWRSPFKSVICTLDGSGGDQWMERALKPDTPAYLLLNGIKKNANPEPISALPEGKTKILFAGRLEKLKGCEEFLDAFFEAARHNSDLSAIIAGNGSMEETMMTRAIENNMNDRVVFLGNISPEQLAYVRQKCDFYVSLNKQGNLSNVNLEALSDSLPTIIPCSDPALNVDTDTERLVPDDVFYRFGKVGDKEALINAILFMADKKHRDQFRQRSIAFSQNFLKSWDARINQELEIYESLRKHDLAIVIADLGSGGAQKVATSLAHDLQHSGKKIVVITLSGAEHDFHNLPEGVTRIALNVQEHSNTALQRFTSNINRIRAIRRAIKQSRAETVVSFIAPTNILCILACCGLKARLIISERNDPSRQSFGRVWDTLRRLLYRHADIVTANSKNALLAMRDYVPAHKLKFIPNGLSAPDAQYIIPFEGKENIILNVGRLHPQKAQHLLIEAFATIHQKHPEWRLMIAGDGSLRPALEAQAKELQISEHITFCGAVNNPYALYARAKIFVLPSLHEGTPNALLEAISCGLAPIISDTCEGALEWIKHNKNGRIVPGKNSDALAEALSYLISNPKECATLGATAREAVYSLLEKNTADLWRDVLR